MAIGPWELLILLFVCGVPLLLGIVFLIVLLRRSRTAASSDSGKSAMEILEQRYARGEIDAEEFEERRNRIMQGSQYTGE